MRRITLARPGAKDVALVTDLCDAAEFPAEDLLDLYKMRWGIGHVFQQITEAFGLSRLIASTPRGTVLQFAIRLLLYDLIQVVRGGVAVAARRPLGEDLFDDVKRELIAWNVVIAREATVAHFERGWTADRVKERVSQLPVGQWRGRWLKAPRKKGRIPRPKAAKRSHSSAHRVLKAHREALDVKKQEARRAQRC